MSNKHNHYKKLFEDAIDKKRNGIIIQRSYRAMQRFLIIKAINELIQREDIQNIHDIGNGNFIIEYEPEVKYENRSKRDKQNKLR